MESSGSYINYADARKQTITKVNQLSAVKNMIIIVITNLIKLSILKDIIIITELNQFHFPKHSSLVGLGI